jgi:hypothetical protein
MASKHAAYLSNLLKKYMSLDKKYVFLLEDDDRLRSDLEAALQLTNHVVHSYSRPGQFLQELDAAKARVESAQIRLKAAKRRAQLSTETREFFDKSFKFGESDLPTRLRIELEAVDATKQAAQAEIAYLASVSALRQALGLLPE